MKKYYAYIKPCAYYDYYIPKNTSKKIFGTIQKYYLDRDDYPVLFINGLEIDEEWIYKIKTKKELKQLRNKIAYQKRKALKRKRKN